MQFYHVVAAMCVAMERQVLGGSTMFQRCQYLQLQKGSFCLHLHHQFAVSNCSALHDTLFLI